MSICVACPDLPWRHPSGLSFISQIAFAKKIPKKFLEAILLDLKNTSILGSKKGKGGGYYLKKSPEEISILQVVRAIDGAVAMIPCVSLNFYETCGFCEDEKNCTINHLFSQVRDETLKILSQNTLADLIKSHQQNEQPIALASK